jgi:hypothetical protein
MAREDIRRFARNLLGQGVQARQLTTLISHLNDVLTERLLETAGPAHGIDLSGLCWLALGSEGRSEQTMATDQDNALILPDDITPRSARPRVRLAASEPGAGRVRLPAVQGRHHGRRARLLPAPERMAGTVCQLD